jgi:hypothetical protein
MHRFTVVVSHTIRRVLAASFINLFRQKMRTKKEQIIDGFVTQVGAQFCNEQVR